MSEDTRTDRERRMSTDRETIREWAREHDVVPVRSPGSTGEGEQFTMLRESEMTADQERVEWTEFEGRLDEGDHVVVYHGEGGDRPMEVTDRQTAMTRADVNDAEFEERILEGETVTTQIEETSVVETVVHEEATVESELVDRTVVDADIVDVRLVDRECTNCDLLADDDASATDGFDRDRYLAMADRSEVRAQADTERDVRGEAEPTGDTTAERESDMAEDRDERTPIDADAIPYSAQLDVRETWSVTRDLVDQYSVESRVTGVDISEDDTLEDHDIDVEGLHRSIAEGGLFDTDESADDVLAQSEVRSEFHENDRIQTEFERSRTVEDEVITRTRMHADATDGERLDMDIIDTREVVGEESADAPGTEMGESAETTGAAAAGQEAQFDDDVIGKKVVDATGDDVGTVTDVEGDMMYVDPHHGIAERVMSTLGWGDDEESYPIRSDHVERIDDDQIVLKTEEHLDEE
ncbi:hypothetical protein BV210_14960 [Halorientalis sp. IM1011]|uniref:PRC-barrel domain-containing protein n=1 Tax=Halorientalis sp. IM1011 TaxID=1932360 RepID=UPI00097CC251|nr:PRC-barrel domain-containing protein [Halorientalis sp. IM1011]AQL43921.1 hypothetical protein BV210_14960 [Halorientalis sp. IM1011]